MKNYEVIEKLMKYPAGCDVRFLGVVEEYQVSRDLNEYTIDASIDSVEINGDTITLCC